MNAEVIRLLDNRNIRVTPMRMLVLEQFLIQKHNLTLSELEQKLYPADRITIYRTLQTFVKSGITHTIDSIDNVVYYGLCQEECNIHVHTDNHPHFYCEKCKRITCDESFVFSLDKINDSIHKVNNIEVNIRGVCPDCIGE